MKLLKRKHQKMSKRSTRFYRRNEEMVMKELGFKPTINSGAGWIQKEDGENDVALCQLKSTDAMSIKINQKDLRILEEHSAISHKIPVFAIQFLNTGEVWCMIKPDELKTLLSALNSQSFCKKGIDKEKEAVYNDIKQYEDGEEREQEKRKVYIKDLEKARNVKNARDNYRKEMEEEYKQNKSRRKKVR